MQTCCKSIGYKIGKVCQTGNRCGQACNGAADMTGHLNGVAAQIQRETN